MFRCLSASFPHPRLDICLCRSVHHARMPDKACSVQLKSSPLAITAESSSQMPSLPVLGTAQLVAHELSSCQQLSSLSNYRCFHADHRLSIGGRLTEKQLLVE